MTLFTHLHAVVSDLRVKAGLSEKGSNEGHGKGNGGEVKQTREGSESLR